MVLKRLAKSDKLKIMRIMEKSRNNKWMFPKSNGVSFGIRRKGSTSEVQQVTNIDFAGLAPASGQKKKVKNFKYMEVACLVILGLSMSQISAQYPRYDLECERMHGRKLLVRGREAVGDIL